ncbi:uncharacterized protein [Pyrus communis]|uniref:uncharacterized protein n=1 Tax=Pyrus communis TaxID=23211 RepID=UPI0035C0D8A1
MTPKTYTKLLVPINQIIHDLKDKLWFKMLQPMIGDTSKMDQTKYCAFYRGPRHVTNNCTTWMKYIEKLVNEGKCNQYVNRLAAQPRKEDAEGVDFPYNDALVISAQLAHVIVDKIMVDNSSSVDILQLSVVQKIGLENTIKRKAEVLSGFKGLTSITIDIITLDVTSPLIVSSQTFMIINDPSPHNEILSLPGLVKNGAVTSIEYQNIQFRILG